MSNKKNAFVGSNSKLNQYNDCPKDYNLEHMVYPKGTKPDLGYFEYGNKVHAAIDKYLKWDLDDVPEEAKCFELELDELRAEHGALSELKVGLTRDGKACNSWWEDGIFIRGAIDCAYFNEEHTEMNLIDWKTSKKVSEDNKDQTELYALMGFVRWPQVEKAIVSIWYTELDEIQGGRRNPDYVYTRSAHFEILKKKWLTKFKAMEKSLDNEEFEPNTSWKCGGCYWNSQLGGPCTAGKNVNLWKTVKDNPVMFWSKGD